MPRTNGQADRYKVAFVAIDKIKPSPENEDIYGEIIEDAPMEALIASIKRRGLAEPILVTNDGYILSGHRRHFACKCLGKRTVPVRVQKDIKRLGNKHYHRELIEYNPQRVKGAPSLLKEALMLTKGVKFNTRAWIEEQRAATMKVDADFMEVTGAKDVKPISQRRFPFLQAVQAVIQGLEDFWPLSIRQIHYNLLNNPPFKQVPKRSKFDIEHYRYANDKASYDRLVSLLTSARYNGQVSMACIDDPTRPQVTYGGWESMAEYVQYEVNKFLTQFHRDRQFGQPRHIEVFGEKSTLYQMLRQATQEYYVPFSIGRGFCSIPVWRDMAERFFDSGKERMTLIIVSDYDPEGLALADDAIRSLETWNIPLDGHRVGVTREQIEDFGLAGDFNAVKESSKHRDNFIAKTGGEETWEVEALPPEYIVEQVKAAIEASMDMKTFGKVCEEEEKGAEDLKDIRAQLADSIGV